MIDTKSPAPSTTPTSKSARSWLIMAAVGVFAAIAFGVLYLFVLAPSIPDGNIGWFLFSFATGLTMIVMPCTLPLAFVIVPLSMGKGLIRGIGMSLAFGLGIAVTLSLYGVAAALLGGVAIDALGADLDSIKNWVYTVAGVFALVFALSEIGLMNFHMPTYKGAAPASIQKHGELIKAFMLGLFLGNVGVGCPHPATPLILIEIASSGDVLYGWLLFLTHAIGRILPLLLLAFMAIIGVNGLNWLMSRKDAVERTTGWAMVFVAGFILTLGLFSHDWWVNSGIHSGLETLTQEARFNALINETLDTNVAHAHGLEEGAGLFGLPLEWGNWFLVTVWLLPMWLWYRKKKKDIEEGADLCQEKVLKIKRNFLIVIAIFIIMIFTHFLPQNFYLNSISGGGHGETTSHDGADGHHDEGASANPDGIHAMPDGTIMNANGDVLKGGHLMPDGTIMLADGTTIGGTPSNIPAEATLYGVDVEDLPFANVPETVELVDGDSYDITAFYVQKEIGNRTLRMLAYNGSVPGPFIKAPQGAEVTINFTNNTDLDQTIHSHGLRLDNNFDGVPGVTQNVVKPGNSHSYTIKFEDAGVYWYHPHTRDDYGQEMGLYGNYIVEPIDGYTSPVNRQIPLVIDDILIENDKIFDFYKEITNFALLGRFGNEYLVNGEQDYSLELEKGEVVRFLVTNVSNARSYSLSLPGAEMKMVGADIGHYEREEFAEDFLISPSERMIVEAYFKESGTYSLTHTTPDGEVVLTEFVVGEESVDESYAEEFDILNENQDVIEEFSTFRSYISKDADKKLLLTVDLEGQVDHSAHGHATDDAAVDPYAGIHAMPNGDVMLGSGEVITGATVMDDGTIVLADGTVPGAPPVPKTRLESLQWNDETMSDKVNTSENVTWKMIDEETGASSMMIPIADWTFVEGDIVKIRLTNDSTADHVMQHPIHLHGQQFVVLTENGEINDNMAWKDTVLVFPGEVVEILVDMSNLGEWMSHCHISEHLHAGMMMQFRVEDESGYATGDEFRSTVTAGMVHKSNAPTIKKSSREFTFESETSSFGYTVYAEKTRFKVGEKQEITLTLFDPELNGVVLSEKYPDPLGITFVKSNNTQNFYTYPGNTTFDAVDHGGSAHDNSDGHHNDTIAPSSEPVHDNSDGHHGFNLIPTAHAHGGTDDGHADATGQVYTYTVPVAFPEIGAYKAFVEFVPEGVDKPIILSMDIEVISSNFSVDNYGWSVSMKWWILLIASLILTVPLVIGVRKYINVK
ncbi:MAG: suppressor of ftsI [Candidatus Paceibacteria bacterium]|jgi:suppressor of ftsI